MKLTVAELMPLKNTISKKLMETLQDRDDIAYVTYEKDEKYEKPEKTVAEVTKYLTEIREDYRKLKVLIEKSNLENTFKLDGKVISVSEAIEYAKQLRGESNYLQRFSRSKKVDRVDGYYNSNIVEYREALFDPNKMKEKAEIITKRANKISMEIEKANHTFEVEFEEAKRYL